MGLSFTSPEHLWVLPVLVCVFLIWRRYRKPGFIGITTTRWLRPVLLRPARLRYLPHMLILMSLGLILVALMEPVLLLTDHEIETRGIDIGIVLDLSDSMREVMSGQEISDDNPDEQGDMSMIQAGKTRLDTTKDALREFISGRSGDRISLVVFSDNAYIVSPLTPDYDYLIHYLDMIDRDSLRGEGMTAIGEGIALANYILYRQRGEEQTNQVILVFTDGENNIGRDPLDVLPQVETMGIRIHMVGVDLEQKIRGNEAVLNLITAIKGYGGSYFDAKSETELLAVSSELDAMEKQLLVSKERAQQMPVYHWFALPAAVLILVVVGLRMIPYFSDFT